MKELVEKANNYAIENTNLVMAKAIAKAYSDGYRDGYKDCQNHVPVNLHLTNTEYVDLGLPSGTLWASDYETDNDDILYLPYEIAQSYHLPSKEQWIELLENCKWEYSVNHSTLIEARCVGKNGKVLTFRKTGMLIAENLVPKSGGKAIFWVINDTNSNYFDAVHMYYHYVRFNPQKVCAIESVFSGYRIPVRQVSPNRDLLVKNNMQQI